MRSSSEDERGDLAEVVADDVGLLAERALDHPGPRTKAAVAPAASAPAQSQAWAAISRTSPIGTSKLRATSS